MKIGQKLLKLDLKIMNGLCDKHNGITTLCGEESQLCNNGYRGGKVEREINGLPKNSFNWF